MERQWSRLTFELIPSFIHTGGGERRPFSRRKRGGKLGVVHIKLGENDYDGMRKGSNHCLYRHTKRGYSYTYSGCFGACVCERKSGWVGVSHLRGLRKIAWSPGQLS